MMKIVYATDDEKDAHKKANDLKLGGLETTVAKEDEKFMVYADGQIVTIRKAVKFDGFGRINMEEIQ